MSEDLFLLLILYSIHWLTLFLLSQNVLKKGRIVIVHLGIQVFYSIYFLFYLFIAPEQMPKGSALVYWFMLWLLIGVRWLFVFLHFFAALRNKNRIKTEHS